MWWLNLSNSTPLRRDSLKYGDLRFRVYSKTSGCSAIFVTDRTLLFLKAYRPLRCASGRSRRSSGLKCIAVAFWRKSDRLSRGVVLRDSESRAWRHRFLEKAHIYRVFTGAGREVSAVVGISFGGAFRPVSN